MSEPPTLPLDTAPETARDAELVTLGRQAAELDSLRREIADLREAVRARDEFISVAAHEVRNPMTPMGMAARSLHSLSQSSPGVPQRLVSGMARLDRIVGQYIKRTTTLLDISRLASGTFELEIAPTDVSDLVRTTAHELSLFADQAGSTVELAVEDGIETMGDELAVQQIIENLLSNAIKYGEGRPIQVSLKRDAECVVLRVQDHGGGISEADQSRITAAFEQAISQRRTSGFGLGLWVVGRLLAPMHGSIQIDSTPGQGSVVSVQLPLRAPANA